MNAFLRLLRWETRLLLRGSATWVVCGALFAAGLLAVWQGARRQSEHTRELAALPGHYAAQMERIARQFSPSGEAGYVSYYAFYPTHHPLPALGALAFGVRDLVPDVVWVRLLGLEGQLYEADLGNPLLQSVGSFDLAFVWTALAPLALLLLAHDALGRDRDAGRLPLVAAQGGSLVRLAAARLLVAVFAVGAAGTAASLVAVPVLRIPPDAAALGWLAAAWAHLAAWAGLAALVVAFFRSAAATLATALTVWVGATVLLPPLLNLALVTAFPVREGLDLTVRQRQESHAAWDKPRADTMEKFFALNPDWSGTPPVTGRFAWRWYYAMQQLGDESVAAESAAYRRHLRARQAAVTRLAWLLPTAYAQLALSARAGTDLDAHLAYLDRVRAFHATLRQRFYPLFFAEASVTPADYAGFPRYTPAAPSTADAPPLWPLLALAAASLALAAHRLRRAQL
jgi:ABC-2 type transport system permease protein